MQAIIALCYFCENHGPRVVLCCQPTRNPPEQKQPNSKNEELPHFYGDGMQNDVVDEDARCGACSSFGSGFGIVSNDHDAKTSYFSSQTPINEQVYHIVKETCLRTLSVEYSTPLKGEPTDDNAPSTSAGGPHRSNQGIIKELKSGENNKAVLFGDRETGFTLSCSFKLRDAKARGFQRQYALVVVTVDEMMLLNNYDFFLNGFSSIILRLQKRAADTFKVEQLQSGDVPLEAAAGRMMFMPQNFFTRTVTLDTERSLATIVSDDEVFYALHRQALLFNQMLYLLRTQAHLLRDNVLEGVPTQDMLVSLEREPETLDESELITSFTTASTRFHIRNLQQLAWRLLSLDERLLSSLIWTVIVVVKSDSPLACKMVLFALAHLLPIGCVRISANSSAYTDQYKHNLLGLTSVEAEVPADKLENTFVLRVQEVDAAGAPDSLDSFNFLVENNPAHGGPRPKLLRRYLQLLSDRSLSVAVVQAAIKAARSEWLNRAKEVFQLSRQHERIDLDGVLRIFRCGVEDSPVILFFQAGLSRVYRQVVFNTILSSGKPPSTSSSAQRPR